MGQTRLDLVEYARMIVHNCLASEFCKLHSTGSTGDFPRTVGAFERYRDDFQVGAPVRQSPCKLDNDEPTTNEPWTPRTVAAIAMILAILSIAIAWLAFAP